MYKEDLDKNTGAWVEEFFSWDRERQARLFRRLVRKGFAAKFNTAASKEAVKGQALPLSTIETAPSKEDAQLAKLKEAFKSFGFSPEQAPALVVGSPKAVRERFLAWVSQQPKSAAQESAPKLESKPKVKK